MSDKYTDDKLYKVVRKDGRYDELKALAETYVKAAVTIQQVCAFTALTVRKHWLEGKNPIGVADLEWIFARNCEGTEQLRGF